MDVERGSDSTEKGKPLALLLLGPVALVSAPPLRSAAVVLALAAAVMLSTVWLLPSATTTTVSYDHRAIVINGQRRILFSGSIHYPRSTPEMWPGLVKKAKDGGLDVIQTYVFWNGHEPSPGQYYFEGRYDLVRFIKVVKDAGLYVNLRIGPYICAEWNFGGFPIWLKYIPGISFRTDNEPFKVAMQRFVQKIVSMVKSEGLFVWQGGPIILSQIENEFGPVAEYGGAADKAYAAWSAKMAIALNTGVPWIMCKEDDAPDPIVNTCNGFFCDGFSPNRPYKPAMWTEAWTGWFTSYGGPLPHRPVENLAFAVVSFIQKGGSFVNYYMYHGGTNFGRTSSGLFVAASYDYDAPIDEYGLLRQPKWGHLKDLHQVIKSCEKALVSSDPTVASVGLNQQLYEFRSKYGDCAAFLANNDTESNATIIFNGMKYDLPPWSISILPNCTTEAYNTAKVKIHSSEMKMVSSLGGLSWNAYTEDSNSKDESSFMMAGLLEQLNVTRDSTDYLWYTTFVDIGQDEGFLKNAQYPLLTVASAGHSFHVFINGQLSGTAYGSLQSPKLTYTGNAKLLAGSNRISILSVVVGLPNGGTHFETWNVGVLGPVTLSGLSIGELDLTSQNWTYQIGLKGEALCLHSITESSSIKWGEASQKQPLTWYKAYFDAPDGDEPLALDMGSMGKGQVWINGESIGRYWPGYKAYGSCVSCDYKGFHNESKCLTSCGESSQRLYVILSSQYHFVCPAAKYIEVFNFRPHLPGSRKAAFRWLSSGVVGFLAHLSIESRLKLFFRLCPNVSALLLCQKCLS